MQASIDNQTLAESDNTVAIEGNSYFPPESVDHSLLETSDTEYQCPWKGDAQYVDAVIANTRYEDIGWSYPDPPKSAIDKVGADFSGYICFDESVVTVKA